MVVTAYQHRRLKIIELLYLCAFMDWWYYSFVAQLLPFRLLPSFFVLIWGPNMIVRGYSTFRDM